MDWKSTLVAFDILVVIFAFMSGILWWQASRRRLRRISKHEDIDHADFNRIIVALNRAQILNSRAALMTAWAATLAGFSLIFHLLLG